MTTNGSPNNPRDSAATLSDRATEQSVTAQTDAQPNTQPITPAAAHNSRHEGRVSRALECTDNSLQTADPFNASLGAMTGSLLLRAAQLDEAIQAKLVGNAPTLEQFQKLADSMELALKLARQIERQYQLMRQDSERKPR